MRTPTVGSPTTAPNNRLAFTLSSIVGIFNPLLSLLAYYILICLTGAAGVDVTITFKFFVPQFDADGSYILNPLTAAPSTTIMATGYSYSAYGIPYGRNTVSSPCTSTLSPFYYLFICS